MLWWGRLQPVNPGEARTAPSAPSRPYAGNLTSSAFPSRWRAQPRHTDGSTEVAATGAVRETGRDVTEARGWDCELLRNQGSLRGCGSPQWQYSHADQPRKGLSESSLSTAEGQATGSQQHRIHRTHQREESGLKWPSRTNSCSEPERLTGQQKPVVNGEWMGQQGEHMQDRPFVKSAINCKAGP